MSLDFIQIARDADIKKDLEGITLENFMKHPSQPIRTRYPIDLGFKKNLERVLKKNTAQVLYGITLLAKTYGIRRIVKKEENILPVAFLIMSTPFIIFVVAITYDVCN